MKFIGSLLVFSFVIFGFVSYGVAGKKGVSADIVRSRPLLEYRKTPVVLRLEHSGGLPVLPNELEINHIKDIHLLIIDPSLTDYHYKNPLPTGTDGDYVFTMTPRTNCDYRVWADLDSITSSGRQFAVADIAGADNCSDKKIDRTTNMSYEGDNYRFILDFDTDGLKVGQDTVVKLTVRNKKGRYVSDLETLWGAYDHMVCFYDDFKTVSHMYPIGKETENGYNSGEPILKFALNPARAGFLKLFIQVKINNIVVSVPFGVEVEG